MECVYLEEQKLELEELNVKSVKCPHCGRRNPVVESVCLSASEASCRCWWCQAKFNVAITPDMMPTIEIGKPEDDFSSKEDTIPLPLIPWNYNIPLLDP
jgi:uncharacterized protein (UPF0212 family)